MAVEEGRSRLGPGHKQREKLKISKGFIVTTSGVPAVRSGVTVQGSWRLPRSSPPPLTTPRRERPLEFSYYYHGYPRLVALEAMDRKHQAACDMRSCCTTAARSTTGFEATTLSHEDNRMSSLVQSDIGQTLSHDYARRSCRQDMSANMTVPQSNIDGTIHQNSRAGPRNH